MGVSKIIWAIFKVTPDGKESHVLSTEDKNNAIYNATRMAQTYHERGNDTVVKIVSMKGSKRTSEQVVNCHRKKVPAE